MATSFGLSLIFYIDAYVPVMIFKTRALRSEKHTETRPMIKSVQFLTGLSIRMIISVTQECDTKLGKCDHVSSE